MPSDDLSVGRCGDCGGPFRYDPDHGGDICCPHCGTHVVICGSPTSSMIDPGPREADHVEAEDDA